MSTVTHIVVLLTTCTSIAAAQISFTMRGGIPTAKPVPVYSAAERASAMQKALTLETAPMLGVPVSVTPNSPYAADGTRLSFWKPSFLVGTPDGGEAGVNFFRLHNEGHVNVGFMSKSAKPVYLDCRLLSAGNITYKIYGGPNGMLREQGEIGLDNNHSILKVATVGASDPISVELWPTPTTELLGFLGCELGTIEP